MMSEQMASVTTSTHLNVSTIEYKSAETTDKISTLGIVHSVIASVGIVTNLTVIVVFLNHRKLRRKVPNICIINQVRVILPPPLKNIPVCVIAARVRSTTGGRVIP